MNVDEPHIRATCLMGGPLTGKTGMLVARARELAVGEAGRERGILFLVAAPVCVRTVQALLERELGEEGCPVRVALPEELALEVLGEPGVAEAFGRDARLMEPYEEQFLLEDMRACQVKSRRLRGVLEFLKSGLSRLGDDDSHWIQTAEERLVYDRLEANLSFTGGIAAFELANLAVRALRNSAELQDRMAYDHVLADDFCMISRASQQLAGLLARRSITVAGDTAPSVAVHEPYPFFEGLAEFTAQHPDAEVITLEQGFQSREIAQSVNRLRSDEGICSQLLLHTEDSGLGDSCEGLAHSPAVRYESCATMGDELRVLFDTVKKRVDAGGTALIVGTNGVWRANVAKAFETNGIAVERPKRTVRIKDYRDDAANSQAIEATMRRLEQNPDDGVAWRCAMGFGDYLARSAALDQLRSVAQPFGMRIHDALKALDEGTLDGANPTEPLYAMLVERYRQVCAELEERRACKVREAEKDTCLAERELVEPGLSASSDSSDSRDNEPSVAVVSPSESFGRQADLVVFGGFVNGFIPSRAYLDPGKLLGSARQRAHESDVRGVHLAASRARCELVFSSFKTASLEVAERLGLHIARIRLKDGVRSCDIEASELLEIVMPRPSP